jgi:hypothetical protein
MSSLFLAKKGKHFLQQWFRKINALEPADSPLKKMQRKSPKILTNSSSARLRISNASSVAPMAGVIANK